MGMMSVKVKGFSCFTGDWCGFDEFKPINIIIGRNNTGKSQLLGVVKWLCSPDRSSKFSGEKKISAVLEADHLRPSFHQGSRGSEMYGDYWDNNGALFVGSQAEWREDLHGAVHLDACDPTPFDAIGRPRSYRMTEGTVRRLGLAVTRVPYPFADKAFRHILADRDIQKEPANTALALGSDGRGATNIIRAHLIAAERIATTERLIQHDLRGALNDIFGPDGTFKRITVLQHENDWEIFLEEERKGLIALSSSGSGLKTIILVLLNMLVIPEIESRPPGDYIFAFEELENNLHPSLLRRLLRYIEQFSLKHACSIFLTTHSSAALDQFRSADHAQFVRVSHDGQHASTQTISAHFDHSQVVGELGARASDILQANGIVWVEGPSDAIYINHWIEIFSQGELIEGRDYACAFYGGSLLARASFTAPGEQGQDFVNLISLNRNAALVCDSDRSRKGAPLKPRVAKAQAALTCVPNAMVWVTAGKEIETYLPGAVIGQALDLGVKADPDQFGLFFPSERPKNKGSSYVEATLGLNAIDKVGLALASRTFMTKEAMTSRFDWANRMADLVSLIRRWNA